jgi:hypothetical protein
MFPFFFIENYPAAQTKGCSSNGRGGPRSPVRCGMIILS